LYPHISRNNFFVPTHIKRGGGGGQRGIYRKKRETRNAYARERERERERGIEGGGGKKV